MNYPQAIVISAGILAGSFLMSNLAQTQGYHPSGGRFDIAGAPGHSVANAWRLDSRTGEVYRCFATSGVYGAVCRKARFVRLESSIPGGSGTHEPDRTNFAPASRQVPGHVRK